jgi:precorrin-8X/cobalt-precorrin-8 methylmutase
MGKPLIFAVGNAPTALFSICELIREGKLNPEMVIGVPVGFVNVVEAKEELMNTAEHYIVNCGRKGGSNVAAAIVNAALYQLSAREE